MTNVLYVPLDDRACNYRFPAALAAMTDELTLLRPPREQTGFVKKPADVDALWAWLFENASACRYAVLSVDTLVYGNLIGSRIHQLPLAECMRRLENFRLLKKRAPGLEIHAFNLVARVAAYNNAFEDPDYWESYGYAIWRYTCLWDKDKRGRASAGEQTEMQALKDGIPAPCLEDFLRRRDVDRAVNLACVDLLADGVFELLTVPKDDTSEYGYAAMDSAALAQAVNARGMANRVFSYPGADEVGSVLLGRVFCRSKGFVPRVYLRYSSTNGPFVVPKYEDRPLNESVKWQVASLGGLVEECPAQADCMLALNASGTAQVEAAEQEEKIDPAFRASMNIPEFLSYISFFRQSTRKAAGIAEVSCCNGCENGFMLAAQQAGVLRDAQAVQRWNTAQNTVGLTLAHTAIVAYYNCFTSDEARWQKSEAFKLAALLADWQCQANLTPKYAAALQAQQPPVSPYRLLRQYGAAQQWYVQRLEPWLASFTAQWYPGYKSRLTRFAFDWDSVFFTDIPVQLEPV